MLLSLTVESNVEPSSLSEASPTIRIQQIGMRRLDVVRRLNRVIFEEERVINRYDRPDLLMLVAYHEDTPIGFKVGYGESREVYYSAKGGILAPYRRQGIARKMLYEMQRMACNKGYIRFAYDTFPNRHYGMLVLGLSEGFRITAADFNPVYRDYRLRLEKPL